MADSSLGLYNRATIRKRVWKKLDTYQPSTVNQDGKVPADASYDVNALFPEPDVNDMINTQLRGQFLDLVTNYPNAFADEVDLDIVAQQTEYELPWDMMQLRCVLFKDPSVTYTIVPVNERSSMWSSEEPQIGTPSGDYTYRRQLNQIVLGWVPDKDNPGGLLVRYVKWINVLENDDAFIESEFAPILQEIVILASAIDLMQDRAHVEVPDWKKDLAVWMTRLEAVARNAQQAPVIQMFNPGISPFDPRR